MTQFDGVAYWKQAFEKSEKAQAKLLDRIYELEQFKHPPFDQYRLGDMETISTGKRKRQETLPAQKANSQAKRKATSTRGAQKAGESLTDSLSSAMLPMTLANANSAQSGFLRRFFDARSNISNDTIQPEQVVKISSGLCHATRDVVFEIIHRSLTDFSSVTADNASEDPEGLQKHSQVIQNGFSTILEAMEKLNDRTASDLSTRMISVSALELLVYILDEIRGTCAMYLEYVAELDTPTIRPSTSKKRRSKPKETERTKMHTIIARWLTKLLHGLVCCIDDRNAVSNSLFEGYCCVLLDRVGEILSLHVFANDVDALPKSPHPKLDFPASLKGPVDGHLQLKLKSSRIEGQLLVYLLEQILNITTRHQTLMTAQSPPLFGLRKNASLSTLDFMGKANSKLQQSLLKGVFGHQDLTFGDSLSKPATSEAMESLTSFEPEISSKDLQESPDWFLGQVWKLLGWECLSDLSPVQNA